MGYLSSMKVKTSITLSKDLLKMIDEYTGEYKNRSEFIETAAWALIAKRAQDERDARDLEILNRRAERLNAEALDVLDYQVIK